MSMASDTPSTFCEIIGLVGPRTNLVAASTLASYALVFGLALSSECPGTFQNIQLDYLVL